MVGTRAGAGDAAQLDAAVAIAHHCSGVCSKGEGEPWFERALELHHALDRPLERGRTHLAYGRALRRLRARVRAREHLRAAIEDFTKVGAHAWGERARSELRATGQTMRRESRDRDALTSLERRIAALVAEGRTNRDIAALLFLSPRTVDFHLRNVFAKLVGFGWGWSIVALTHRVAHRAGPRRPGGSS